MVPMNSDTIMQLPVEVPFHHIVTLLMGYLMGAEWVPPEEAGGITVEEDPMPELGLEGAFIYRNRESFVAWTSEGWTSEHGEGQIHVLRSSTGEFTFATEPGSDTEELVRRFAGIFS